MKVETSFPLVSILMTVFNREKFIAEAIESVINSSFINWELIILDDCSTDSSYEIALKYAEDEDRISLYRNEKNLGQFANRNKAAEYAKGKYIKYLDSDDLIYPHGLEIMVNAMEKFPECAFGIPGPANDYQPFPYKENSSKQIVKHFTENPVFIFGPSAVIFKTKCFKEINGFGKDTYVGSDVDILLKLAIQYPFVKMNPSLIWWREHENQEIKIGTENYDYFYNYYPRMYDFLCEHKELFTPNEYKLAHKKLRNLYLGKVFRLIKKFLFKPVVNFIKNNPKFIKQLPKKS